MKALTEEQQEVWDRLQNGMVNNSTEIGATFFNMANKKLYVYDGFKWNIAS